MSLFFHSHEIADPSYENLNDLIMWYSHTLTTDELHNVLPLLCAVAPKDLATFEKSAQSWLERDEHGLLLLKTKSACIAGLAFFQYRVNLNQLSIPRCRYIEIGRPNTTVQALLESLLDLATENQVRDIHIHKTAANTHHFTGCIEGPCGTSFGFRRVKDGWISQLPQVSHLLQSSVPPY